MNFDVAVIGAGAAGMMCASVAGQLGLRVVLVDHASKLAEKIRISGGGRCNFTNLHAGPGNYLSENPHFCRSALARYTPQDFLSLLRRHGVAWHEKHKGQLFCNHSAEEVIQMLVRECGSAGVAWRMGCQVHRVNQEHHAGGQCFYLETSAGGLRANALVVATGGLSIPKIGATDLGYRLAKQFGLPLVDMRPALVPLTFDAAVWSPFAALAGVSLEVEVGLSSASDTRDGGLGKTVNARLAGKAARSAAPVFREDLLFTHRGLSGPGILQISSFWTSGTQNVPLQVNLLPDRKATAWLLQEKRQSKKQLANVLSHSLPGSLAEHWVQAYASEAAHMRMADMPDRLLKQLGENLNRWQLLPSGSEGYRKAEVTRGGVDTRALSSTSMMANTVPGLYFIGEVVDVTGWLGGYNFQWAWSSAVAAGRALAESALRS